MLAIARHAESCARPPALEREDFPIEFSDAERRWLGFTHADVGATLLDKWGFAPEIVEPVHWQQRPEPEAMEHPLTATLVLARWARAVLCCGGQGVPPEPPVAWLEAAGIEPDMLPDWLVDVRQRFARAHLSLEG